MWYVGGNGNQTYKDKQSHAVVALVWAGAACSASLTCPRSSNKGIFIKSRRVKVILRGKRIINIVHNDRIVVVMLPAVWTVWAVVSDPSLKGEREEEDNNSYGNTTFDAALTVNSSVMIDMSKAIGGLCDLMWQNKQTGTRMLNVWYDPVTLELEKLVGVDRGGVSQD